LAETYIKVQGKWRYVYRAVDKQGNTVDFLLTKHKQRMSAQSFLIKAIEGNGLSEIINIDKSGANISAIKIFNKKSFSRIEIRQCKYLNNIVEQDNRFIKRRISSGLGFKEFESAKRKIAGIEVVRMIQKKQMDYKSASTFKSFCSWLLKSF
jgi:putative transposase